MQLAQRLLVLLMRNVMENAAGKGAVDRAIGKRQLAFRHPRVLFLAAMGLLGQSQALCGDVGAHQAGLWNMLAKRRDGGTDPAAEIEIASVQRQRGLVYQ